MSLGQQGQIIWQSCLSACGLQVGKPLTHLGQALFLLSLCGQRPAPDDHRPGQVVSKAMLRAEGHGSLSPLAGSMRLVAKLMEHGGIVEGQRQTKGVCQLLSQDERLWLLARAWSG